MLQSVLEQLPQLDSVLLMIMIPFQKHKYIFATPPFVKGRLKGRSNYHLDLPMKGREGTKKDVDMFEKVRRERVSFYMSIIRQITSTIMLVVVFLTVTACTKHEDPVPSKELLIYCGITMIHPMREIADIIEEQDDCIIKITKGGSGYLLHAIKENKVGDLYLPGSDSYMQTCISEGLVKETILVGYNKAALIVPKGNPKKLTGDPAQLTNIAYGVLIANPESGSIGRESIKVLDRRGVTDTALNNVIYFTLDSKDITKAIKRGDVDLAINWYATSYWPENKQIIESIVIDEQYAPRKKLLLGLLECSA